MESMTGYAFVEKSTDQFSYSVEIKSVNSRYLEIYVNMPRILRSEEGDLKAIIKKYLPRGKVELNIELFDWSDTRPISLNGELVERYFRELQKIQKKLKLDRPAGLDSILGLDGITQRERSVLSSRSRGDIRKTVVQAARQAIEMRRGEGQAIRKDVDSLIGDMELKLRKIRDISATVVSDRMDALRERIAKLAATGVDDPRLITEAAIIADRLDINEEIVRFEDHIKKFRATMKMTDQIGKKLDFLAQEIFRETNTIGSKANSSAVSHLVVDIKNSIEKIREHCRNVA